MNNLTQKPHHPTENIAHEAIQILKTVMLLEQSYASSYLVRILQQTRATNLENHQTLKPLDL